MLPRFWPHKWTESRRLPNGRCVTRRWASASRLRVLVRGLLSHHFSRAVSRDRPSPKSVLANVARHLARMALNRMLKGRSGHEVGSFPKSQPSSKGRILWKGGPENGAPFLGYLARLARNGKHLTMPWTMCLYPFAHYYLFSSTLS